jgi:hypothetical protein
MSNNTNVNFMLNNSSNYNKHIKNTSLEILTKVTQLIIEYMLFISEKMSIKNKIFYSYVFEKGMETLFNVFSLIFYYTKNLELTYYYTQKSYYFYIEFIEQMSHDNVTFLQLSTKDAILFVYKKTIFEINNEYKKNMQELNTDEKIIIKYVNEIINIYKLIIQTIMNNINYANKKEYFTICSDSIETISILLNKNKFKDTNTKYIELFVIFLNNKEIEINLYFEFIVCFIRNVIKNKKIDKIKQHIYNLEINGIIYENDKIDSIFSSIQ